MTWRSGAVVAAIALWAACGEDDGKATPALDGSVVSAGDPALAAPDSGGAAPTWY